jgi:hypothetical protein
MAVNGSRSPDLSQRQQGHFAYAVVAITGSGGQPMGERTRQETRPSRKPDEVAVSAQDGGGRLMQGRFNNGMTGYGAQNIVSDRAEVFLMREKFRMRRDMRPEPPSGTVIRIDEVSAFDSQPG